MNSSFLKTCIVKKWPKQRGLKAIYEEGKRKVDESFDLLKIIKDIRYMKTLTIDKLNPTIKEEIFIKHSEANLINLDLILNPEDKNCLQNHKHDKCKVIHKYNPIDMNILKKQIAKQVFKKQENKDLKKSLSS